MISTGFRSSGRLFHYLVIVVDAICAVVTDTIQVCAVIKVVDVSSGSSFHRSATDDGHNGVGGACNQHTQDGAFWYCAVGVLSARVQIKLR